MSDELRLDIDKARLDQEWREQPALYWKWAKKVADAQLVYDNAKSELAVEKAEADLAIRKSPNDYGIGKLTEAALSAAIDKSRVIQRCEEKIREARHALDIAKAAVDALEHRKRALSMLVELWIRDYYSDPISPPLTEAGAEWSKKQVRQAGRLRRRSEEEKVED